MTDTNKIQALADHLDTEPPDITVSQYDDCIFEHGQYEYLVLTDSEADQKWDEYLENYIEECILDELPEQYRQYFDNESWKSDAKMDGRGHSLSSYDGEEYDVEINGETYYIYRTN